MKFTRVAIRLATAVLSVGALTGPADASTPLSPNQGSLKAAGSFSDQNGRRGTWSIDGALARGAFTGVGVFSVGGATFTAPLRSGASYLNSASGRCIFSFEEGRARAEITGRCDTGRMTGVSIDAFTPDTGTSTVSGGEGTITVGRASAARTAGVIPTTKLGCWWTEVRWRPIGAGATTTQLRPSSMGSLTLGSGGTYRTTSVGGRFVREGDKVRFTTGPYAGAVGTLRPDNSGEPAVYFEKDENRTSAGEMLVDPNTTACTVGRGG